MTASYRSTEPLRVTDEVDDWVGHSPEQLRQMRDNLVGLNAEGRATIIEDWGIAILIARRAYALS